MKSYSFVAASAAFLFSASIFAAPVNINSASATEIADALNGVGMNRAQAIVDFRLKNGEFKKASDITMVKGIGSATFEKNKPDILLK